MKNRGLSQEGLKLIACVTMLLDHIGAVIVLELFYREPSGELLDLYEALRLIGRIAFPVYCFLLAEGSVHTRNPLRYGLRLVALMLLAEIPYDLAFYGGANWQNQNVMVTLLLAFLTLEAGKKCPNQLLKLLVAVPFAGLAELARGDYGAEGVLLVVLFALTREMPRRRLFQFLGMWFLFSPSHAMLLNWLGGIRITTQEWALLALIPISIYSGRKTTGSRAAQWGFYLFYPAHLLVLYLIGRL